MAKQRNTFVDIMRGVAMLLVVLGHTMTECTVGSQSTFLYNIVWSLQMPLFILISGYVTRYSKEIKTISELFKFFLKRTTAYLLPFAVWSFLVRGLILDQKIFLDIKYMLWHMDLGYWFLVTIWTISIFFGISSFVSSKVKNSVLGEKVLFFVIYVCGMALLGSIGYFAGMSFFCIKLTLYYMPFYFAGYLYGQYSDKIFSLSFGITMVDIIVAFCLALWIFALIRLNMYSLPDGSVFIIVRATVSLCGCIAVCGLLKGVVDRTASKYLYTALTWIGTHSLEIYLAHYLFLSIIKTAELPIFNSIKGVLFVVLNYVITILITIATVKAINSNRTLKFCFYGKKTVG